MSTQTIEGQLEIDSDRGVIYFHSNEGYTALRIGGLPQPVPHVTPKDALDVYHMNGCSWDTEPEPIIDAATDEALYAEHAEDHSMSAEQRKEKAKAKLEKTLATLRKLEKELEDAGIPPKFNVQGTITGRLSCKEPNVKVMPMDQDEIDNTVANVAVQIWSDDQDKWLDYGRHTWAGAERFKQTLFHSGSPTRQYRAISDYGNGDVLWSLRDEPLGEDEVDDGEYWEEEKQKRKEKTNSD